MILDNYIANILLNRKISVDKVRLILRVLYLLVSLYLYRIIFYNTINPIPSLILFIILTLGFELFRTQQLERYLKERK
jgi:hypothetical protein